jgi:putative polyketide hydroxylase
MQVSMVRDKRAVDVVVIGAGPVGLSVANLLGRAGIATLVLERHQGTADHPRASGIHRRTMELFRQWGFAREIRSVAVPEDRAQGFGWMTRLNGLDLGRLVFTDDSGAPGDADISPELPCFCPQLAYEPILLAAARRHSSVSVEFDCEVDSLRQDQATAVVGFRRGDRSEIEEVEAPYVVAADGADSPTRQRLGVAEGGTPRFGHSVNIYFEADLNRYVRTKPFMLFWIVNAQTQGTIGAASRDGRRWTYNFDAQPELEYSRDQLVQQVRLAVGDPNLAVEVLGVLRWDYDQAVADRWRIGRVLLAGDAAHRFPPHGAFGMNSGVQDANNLAWKVIHVLRGRAGDGLLDTFEVERKPVAEDNSRQALANTRALVDTGWHDGREDELASIELPEAGRAIRDRIAAAVSGQRAHLRSDGQQFGTIYVSDAVVPDGTEPVRSTVSDYRETGHPGARAPHIWLRRSDGQRLSTLDIGASGFVVLAGAGGQAWLQAAAVAAEIHGVEVTHQQIGGGSDLTEDGRDWEATYGIAGDGAVLIRPDGHVGARFATAPTRRETALTDALGQILALGVSAHPLTHSGEMH